MSSSTPRPGSHRRTHDGSDATSSFAGTRRFAVRRRLGEGNMGAVYLAFDRQLGVEVALKTLRYVDAAGIYRFKREFRALADVRHPNLVKLHELFCEDGAWFFTMEYIEGRTFLEHVLGPAAKHVDERTPRSTMELAASATTDLGDHGEQVHGLELLFPTPLVEVDRLCEVMRQIAAGLEAVHAAGKLHRDLKSDNVLVTAGGRAVLLDFGIAAEQTGQLHRTLDVGVVGTPAYMSPEQAQGHSVDAATDWYAFGVMLYEALTGSVPFDGTFQQVIRQKQQFDPLPPSQVVSGVPPDLDELCSSLLARDPLARPRGDAVIRALTSRRAVSAPPPRPSLPIDVPPPLVGRRPHLDALEQALASTAQGRPSLVFVQGESGMGKTMLVDAFLARLRESGDAVVLKGACYERESVPFKAWDSLIDTLSRYLRRLNPVRAAELLPRDVLALAQLFPVLKRVEVVKGAKRRGPLPDDPQELRRRAFAALRELFSRIADQQPLVLSIDDLQWGDVDSARLICDLLSGSDCPALLCIGTYRTGDVVGSACLQTLVTHTREGTHAEVRQLSVGALSPEESYELARESLGQDAWIEARMVGAEAQGSPFLLSELVGYAQRARERDGVMPSDLTLHAALSERFAALSRGARSLLELVAVAGRPVPEHMLALAATFEIDLQDALSELRGARLLRGVATRALRSVDVYHDRVRRAVLAGMGDAQLATWHRRLASTLEASGTVDLEALARHLLGAGEVSRAGLYARRAAQQAVDALAFDKAAELFAIAAQHAGLSESERTELLAHWGDALVNAGRPAQAAEVYFRAAEASATATASMLRRKAGVALLRAGELERGLDALRDTLGELGFGLAASLRDAVHEARELRERLAKRGFVFARRTAQEISAPALELFDTKLAVTVGLLLTEIDRVLPLVVRLVLDALELGEPTRVACALCLFDVYVDSGFVTTFGDTSLGALELAQTLVARGEDARARAWLAYARGHAALRRGELATALSRLQHAEEQFRARCSAADAEMRLCRQLVAAVFVQTAQWSELDRCDDWAREAQEHGDHTAASRFRMLATPLALAQDVPERAQRHCEESARVSQRPGCDPSSFARQVSLSQLELYRGDPRACSERASELDAFFASALAGVPLWRAHCHLLRALLWLAGQTDGDASADLLARTEAELDHVDALGLACVAPQAQVVRAMIAVRRAQRDRALVLLDEALTLAQPRADCSVVLMCARLRKGELVGGAEGASLVREAETFMRVRGVRDPSALTRLFAPELRAPQT